MDQVGDVGALLSRSYETGEHGATYVCERYNKEMGIKKSVHPLLPMTDYWGLLYYVIKHWTRCHGTSLLRTFYGQTGDIVKY
ncbi:hypothetical protein J6590_022835 [Homalodisca vitripennis]|nr:hypothetical protein J6590_022835 [Homalodisca vitripennis]